MRKTGITLSEGQKFHVFKKTIHYARGTCSKWAGMVIIQRAFSMQSHTGFVCTNREAARAQGALVRHQGKEMHR